MVYSIPTSDNYKVIHNKHFALEAKYSKADGAIIVIDTQELGTTLELVANGIKPESIRVVNRSKTEMFNAKQKIPTLNTHATTFNTFATNWKKPVCSAYIDSCSNFSNIAPGLRKMFDRKLFSHKSILFVTCVFRADIKIKDEQLYSDWLDSGMVEYEDDTPCIQRANMDIHQMAYNNGYFLARYNKEKVEKTQYRNGTYLLRYIILTKL
jgi:hypothetical protein